MVTGASTANLALILVDARKGVIEQTKRHTFIASLLQIPHVFVCINKMDLVDYSQEAYDRVVKEYTDFAAKLNVQDVRFIPMSALHGDNVVTRSERWVGTKAAPCSTTLKPCIFLQITTCAIAAFPYKTVIRPHTDEYHDFRGYAGRVARWYLQKRAIKWLPSRPDWRVKSLVFTP